MHLHFAFGSSISDNYIEDFGSNGNGPGASGPTTGEATYAGIQCVMQNGAASVISGNKVHQFRPGVRNVSTPYHYVEVSFSRDTAFAEVSVFGNVIRGDNVSADVGLAYVVPQRLVTGGGGGGGAPTLSRTLPLSVAPSPPTTSGTGTSPCCDLRVMSSGNHVQLAGSRPLLADPGVTLVKGL